MRAGADARVLSTYHSRSLGCVVRVPIQIHSAFVTLRGEQFCVDLDIFDDVITTPSCCTIILESDSSTLANFVFVFVRMVSGIKSVVNDRLTAFCHAQLKEVIASRWLRLFLPAKTP